MESIELYTKMMSGGMGNVMKLFFISVIIMLLIIDKQWRR